MGANVMLVEYDDGRGKYPDAMRIRAPRGWRACVRKLAEQEGVSVGEFLRRAIRERIAASGRASNQRF
jgi:hypothetical protein